jgi:nucleoside-triphosphatase THEP1
MTDIEIDPRKLAAVVYDDHVAIDALLTAFAADLRAEGARIAGFIQLSRMESGGGPGAPMRLQDVATGEVLPICQEIGANAGDCRLDPERFQEAARRLRGACEAEADLIFVSRFGKMEAEGRGFRDPIARAVENGRPVLTALRRGLIQSWFTFTGGVGTLLDTQLWVLKQWWREIAPRHRHAG